MSATLGMLLAGGLLVGCLAIWLVVAEVTVYEVTGGARLEVGQAAAPIAARVGGRVLSSQLALGRQVEAGEVLVELDVQREKLLLLEGRARLRLLTAQVEPLQRELAARERAFSQTLRAGQAQLDEARTRLGEADVLAKLTETDAARSASLLARGFIAQREADRFQADAQVKRAGAEALRITVTRTEAEYQRSVSNEEADLARLRREQVLLQEQQATEQASIERLEHELELRRIRAPVSGRIGEAVTLQVGAMLREGEGIGAVVPSGSLKVVAEFAPVALGRLKVGQRARLRLDGFPSIQYGATPAMVERIGSEPREGRVRVELSVAPGPLSAIPLQHGLPGSVEVEVERVSPATLVLRAVGRYLLGDRAVGR